MSTMWRLLLLPLAAATKLQLDDSCAYSLHSSLPGGPSWTACRADGACIRAIIPGTALTSMLANGSFAAISDPYFADNLAKIPDVNNTGAAFYSFTYAASFALERGRGSRCAAQSRVWLDLRGINYRAVVHVNGVRVGAELVGMYSRHRLDVTAALAGAPGGLFAGQHKVSIQVKPPDAVGNVTLPGQGGSDHQLATNAAEMQYTGGWDWAEPTPDRNTGIWDAIALTTSGEQTLRHPHVRTESIDYKAESATLKAEVTVENHGAATFSGRVEVSINGIKASVAVSVPGGGTVVAKLGVVMKDAELWWPHTHGKQPLYTARMQLLDGGAAVATEELTVGIREVEAYIDEATGGRAFKINRIPVFIQGGNWIGTDQLLRYSTSQARYDAEVGLHASMGLNLIRVWGGGLTERPEFYNAADRLGVLVMQEFWMTGDNNGRWAGSFDWPHDHKLEATAAKDMILMLRSHASLLFWCGGNELIPSDSWQMSWISGILPEMIAELDEGRFYIPSSMANTNASFSLAPKDGPYNVIAEEFFFQQRSGESPNSMWPSAFQPELGSVSTPVAASLKKFLSKDALAPSAIPPEGAGHPEGSGVHPEWAYHKFITYTEPEQGQPKPHMLKPRDHIYSYGIPANIEEYAVRAQLAQFVQFRALFEGYSSKLFVWYTAVIFWKTQSPWPTLRGAFYDSYLAMTGGGFGAQAALKPLHAQLNLPSLTPTVVNKMGTAQGPLEITVQTFGFDGKDLVPPQALDCGLVGSNKAVSCGDVEAGLAWPEAAADGQVIIYRLSLALTSDPETVLDTNDYWRSTPTKQQNMGQLGKLRDSGGKVSLTTSATSTVDAAGVATVLLQLSNPAGQELAFGAWAELHTAAGEGDARVLPVYQDAQLLSLRPGEARTVSFRTAADFAKSAKFVVELKGWNVKQAQVVVDA